MIHNRHGTRARWLFGVALLILLAGFAAGWYTVRERDREVAEVQAVSQPLADQLVELCAGSSDQADRLRDVGLCERARDAQDAIAGDPTTVEGPPGPPGADGVDGADGTAGVDGADGRPGRDGATGRPGATGPRGLSCTEELGLDACRGPVGPAGPAGADSTVPGPAGPQGPAGERGEPGPAGTARPGSYTCPDGEYLAGFDIADGGSVTLTCRPLSTFP
ncbi:hypothetical protein QWY28_17415 [Nocardioides sp. SOB77]|uniref:Collagen-like protein n=1 Tax=Nocardioides oceani TaxID=3058369 RepID=A0ABT8FJN9_9ACTN|nr:hypothetical protein [Nocardioides oceani]MDN4174744.1 hypothetical protein [Nocardioides oceani]